MAHRRRKTKTKKDARGLSERQSREPDFRLFNESMLRIRRYTLTAGAVTLVLALWMTLAHTLPSLAHVAERFERIPIPVLGVTLCLYLIFSCYWIYRVGHIANPMYVMRLTVDHQERKRHERIMIVLNAMWIASVFIPLLFTSGVFEGTAAAIANVVSVSEGTAEVILSVVSGLALGVIGNATWDLIKHLLRRKSE